MRDALYTQRKNEVFNLRLPPRMKEEIRRLAELDSISINSAILQRLAKSLREDRVLSIKNSEAPTASTVRAPILSETTQGN